MNNLAGTGQQTKTEAELDDSTHCVGQEHPVDESDLVTRPIIEMRKITFRKRGVNFDRAKHRLLPGVQ